MIGAIEGAKRLYELGYKIVVHTSRHWGDYEVIEKWLNYYEIPFKFIWCGKPLVKFFIDDLAIPFDGDWEATIKKIEGINT